MNASSLYGRQIPPAVRLVREATGIEALGRICVATIDVDLLCGEPAPRAIGDIRLCDWHYERAALWREELPGPVLEADIAERRSRELAHVEAELAHQARLEERRREVALVYYLRRADGHIKIGTTTGLAARLRTLRREHGALAILLTHSGSYRRENELHERFAELGIGGEWFIPRKRLTDWIKKCRLDPAISASQVPGTVDMETIRLLVREGNRASLAHGRAEDDRATARIIELVRDRDAAEATAMADLTSAASSS